VPEIPQEAIDDAVDAWHEAPRNEHEAIALDDLMRHVLEAAAPYIAAQALIGERRRAIRLVRRTLVPRGCEPTKDAADLIDAIKGDLDV